MNKVKEMRKEKGWTQSELAIEVGVTPKYISFIESGERTPSLAVADKIAIVLGGTVDQIFLTSKCTKCT